MEIPKVLDNKLQEKTIVNFVFLLLYFIPFLIFIVFEILFINYVVLFQSGLLILFAVITGFLINLIWGIELKNKTQRERNKISFISIKINRVNIILGSIVSIIFIGVVAYNIGHILIKGCTTSDDFELLIDGEDMISLDDITHTDHHKEKRFIPNPEVKNFVIDRICKHEQVLFFIFIAFLLYLFVLHLVTIYCYLFHVGYLEHNKPSKYFHFIFTIIHFIPIALLLFCQIILVHKVTVFYTGLLLPFGLVNGIFISVLCESKLSNENLLIFIIKRRSRYLIIISSVFSFIFICIYLGYLYSLYYECGTVISMPVPPSVTEFIITEICQHEYIHAIIYLVFLSFLIILHISTVLVYSIYYSIKNLITI